MRLKYKRLLSSLLLIIIFLSGIYFDKSEAGPELAYATECETSSRLTSINTKIHNNEPYISRLLGGNCISHLEIAVRRINDRSVVKLLAAFFGTETFCGGSLDFYVALDKVQLSEPYSKTIVLNYIHNTDGKK